MGEMTDLDSIESEIRICNECPLHATRTNVVIMRGSKSPWAVFVGEAPGADEDLAGVPFVGAAGRHLNKAIREVMRLGDDDYAITNVVKCRPPGNRKPTSAEIVACMPFVEMQLRVFSPKVVVLLGNTALKAFFPDSDSITWLSGHRISEIGGAMYFALLHPSVVNYGKQADKFWMDVEHLADTFERIRGRKPPRSDISPSIDPSDDGMRQTTLFGD